MTVQWGIMSTARINGKLLAGAAQSETAAVTAVASRDVIRAREYAEEHGIERAHGSYEELLADPQLDAIYISLPNSMHLEWTERALRPASTCCARSRWAAARRTFRPRSRSPSGRSGC